jgi:hypothetical protein
MCGVTDASRGRYALVLGGGAHKQAGMKSTITVTEESAPSFQY